MAFKASIRVAGIVVVAAIEEKEDVDAITEDSEPMADVGDEESELEEEST